MAPARRRHTYQIGAIVAAAALSACVQTEVVEVPTPSPATVRIVRLTPLPGSEISPDTTIIAELEYNVEQFEPKRFTIAAMAAQNRPDHGWSLVPVDGEESHVLPQASGTITARFEAKNLWDKPDLKRPFEITFSVAQFIGTMGVTTQAAKADAIIYKAAR